MYGMQLNKNPLFASFLSPHVLNRKSKLILIVVKFGRFPPMKKLSKANPFTLDLFNAHESTLSLRHVQHDTKLL